MSKGNAIPTHTRTVIRERDGGHCMRCGSAVFSGELHHRRRRGRRDGNEHGYENLITLCSEDHRWVHNHPELARIEGFIVSMHHDDVAAMVVASFMGPVTLDHDGGITWA